MLYRAIRIACSYLFERDRTKLADQTRNLGTSFVSCGSMKRPYFVHASGACCIRLNILRI